MHLIPHEVSRDLAHSGLMCRVDKCIQLDGLLIAHAGFVAQRRLARGIRLNHGEATVNYIRLYAQSIGN